MRSQLLADFELERDYLATVLSYGSLADHVRSIRLDQSDLASTVNQNILSAIYETENKTGEISATTVINHLKSKGDEGACKLTDELSVREVSIPTRSEIESIVHRIRELAECREINKNLLDSRACFEEGNLKAGKEYLKLAHESLQNDRSMYQMENISSSMRYAYDTVVNGKRATVKFGNDTFDSTIGFLSAGSAMVIGGKTTAGKSTLALTIALSMESIGNKPGIISLEDGPDVWGSRCLSTTSGMPVSYAKGGGWLTDDEMEIAREIMGFRLEKPIGIEMAYGFDPSPQIVLEMINRLVRDKECNVIFVDYLQAISIDLRAKRIDKAYSNTFNKIKATGKMLGVPVVVLSQIKRIEGKEPSMHDLKETGDIENGAEVVILIWHDKDETFVKTDKIKWTRREKYLRAKVNRDETHGMITGFTEIEK